MYYLILLLLVLTVAGFVLIWRHYGYSNSRIRSTSLAGEGAAQDIPPYALSSWIDDEVATRQLYNRPDVTAEELANELGISKTSLIHTISAAYDKTVPEYLDDRRIQAACRLLREQPDRSIDDISTEVGFSTVKTFQIVFVHTMGLTPEKYRSQMKA